jgi:hypothetical protein
MSLWVINITAKPGIDTHSIQTGVHSKEDADLKILIKDDADQEKDMDQL